jgi:SWI/SNF-related matrix-associated actin-dependent regulator of chromatin subfamily A-like protein 1
MELETWLCPAVCKPDAIVLIDSPSKVNIILHKPHQFAIISYNYLTKLEGILCAKKYKMIIIDESHLLKNGKAKRTKSMNVIVEGAARVVLLTGTPALSRPYELFTQLHLIAPLSWDSEQHFCRRYCQGKGTGTGTGSWGGEAKGGASHTAELHAMLFGTIMIRRLKRDTLTELPPKTRHIVRVEVLDEAQKDELM